MAMYPENWASASSRYSCSTCRRLFFPHGLDPVLGRGIGDEGAVGTPEVPGGGAVRQAILHDAPHRGGDDAVGVVTAEHGQIQHIGDPVMIPVPAIVLGIEH